MSEKIYTVAVTFCKEEGDEDEDEDEGSLETVIFNDGIGGLVRS